ncbi:CRISP/Allergen/PR-1-like [Atheta coriaria]|uniref:CRISP/Allergen/PR-1-like n=1 Tax=Dalotia coriaria TaxID=877792 RepID=UPI0031F3576C
MNLSIFAAFVLIAFNAGALAENCPDGSEIYAWGIDEEGKRTVVDEHNRYRQMILDGTVPNQPKGRDVLLIEGFDDNLANEGRKVSKNCKMEHIIGSDDRWSWVGQNLYISWSSENSPGQDWAAAVNSWYSEHKNFIYPDQSTGVTGHYTQVIWHDSNTLGCDFIQYYDKNQPQYPYAKLYTCNYGPGGNWQGEAPYERA